MSATLSHDEDLVLGLLRQIDRPTERSAISSFLDDAARASSVLGKLVRKDFVFTMPSRLRPNRLTYQLTASGKTAADSIRSR